MGRIGRDERKTRVDEFVVDQGTVSERSDLWEWALSRTFVPMSVHVSPTPTAPGREFIRGRGLYDLCLVDMQCGPCSAERTRATASDGEELVAVLVGLEGSENVAAGDDRASLARGQLALWDSTRSARFDVPRGIRKRSLLVPRQVLGSSGHTGRVSPIALAGAGARVLAGYLEVLCEALDGLPDEGVLAARNATLELLHGLFRAAGPSFPWGAAPALRAEVDRWIDANLAADITPASAAAAHSVSIRTLHRLFQESGMTFTADVRARRLGRARDELLATDHPISAIAARWRFSDSSHFTRVFREEYGEPPAFYRLTSRREG